MLSEEKVDQKDESKTIPYDRFKKVNDDLKWFKETFESLGLNDLDSLKGLVSDYNEKKKADEDRQRQEMTELDRLQADLKAKDETFGTLQSEYDKLKNSLLERDKFEAFRKVATSADYGIPAERVEAAYKLADMSAVNVGDNGVEGVSDAVKGLVEQYDFLIAKAKQEPKAIGDETNTPADGEAKTLQAQLEDAKARGDFSATISLSNKLSKLLGK